jgi:hypothetical protein
MSAQPLTDPREVRKLLGLVVRGHANINGDGPPGACCALVRNTMMAAEVAGLSGEDAMTMLAYRALLALEATQERLLEQLSFSPPPRVFVDPRKLHEVLR